MFAIFRLQLLTLFKSNTFFFIVFLLAINFLVIGSNSIPFATALLTTISSNVMLLAFFQYGTDYGKVVNSNLIKKIHTSDINIDKFKFVFLIFSIVAIFVFSSFTIGVFYLLTSAQGGALNVKWNYFWWDTFIYWIITDTLLKLSIAYFLIKMVSNRHVVTGIFTTLIILSCVGGFGTFSSYFQYASDPISGDMIVVGRSVNILSNIQHINPIWYSNQLIIGSFLSQSSSYYALKPFNFANYTYQEQYLFWILPLVYTVILFAIPKFRRNNK